ncbi:MAG TPA: hypothetical protein VFM35_09770 [Candidatus Binatia bacterium]|nr:hypothetical protein [Candidatus Binatia bacterium]
MGSRTKWILPSNFSMKGTGAPPTKTSASNSPDATLILPLAISPFVGMVSHMKTTLNIDDTVMAQLKREAARQKRTMSELVETALRGLFRSQKKRQDVPPLPTFHSGGTLVDVADRDALYQAMEGR